MRSRIIAGPRAVLEALNRGGEGVQVVFVGAAEAQGRKISKVDDLKVGC